MTKEKFESVFVGGAVGPSRGDTVKMWPATEHETVRRGTSRFWLGVGASTLPVPEVPRDLLALAPGRPVRVVLAIDRSSSMKGKTLDAAKRAAQVVIEMMRDGDELGVLRATGRPRQFPRRPAG